MSKTRGKQSRLLLDTVRRYDTLAPEYRRDARGKPDKDQVFHLNNFSQILGSPPKAILDPGCGTGKDLLYLSQKGYEMFGVDMSKGMLKEAMRDMNSSKNVHLARGDFRDLVFPHDFFDGVWCSASLVHLPYDEKRTAFEEFYRVLKDGGVLCVGIQNLLSADRLLRIINSYREKSPNALTTSFVEGMKSGYAYYDGRHWFFPTKFSMEKLMKNTGFKILYTSFPFSGRLRMYATK